MSQSNHLISESSPYLLQHAHNPVNWYPWGEEAFQRAREENKLIIISIGYSSCHWCHVMEEESFENEEAARLMNDHFISIKVDREERPDIDAHYMNAIQLITGRGGWPLNMFALPDGRPFYGGTYFPRDQWMSMLPLVAGQYHSDKVQFVKAADSIEQGISNFRIKLLDTEETLFSMDELTSSVQRMGEQFDLTHGGIKGAPKFPMPVLYRFLLSWSTLQKDKTILDFVLLTLKRMASGGIYDQIGGGFSRYSTDKIWKVPHFEKMLYDNAQLVSLYSKAFQLTRIDRFKDVVHQTLSFIEESMTSPEGVFYSALDADSEGEEGLYYTWNKRELLELLAEDYPLAVSYFGIGAEGVWEKGRNILLLPEGSENPPPNRSDLERIRETLKTARDKRIPPGLDDKTLTSWNALMITAYTDAYIAFGERDYLKRAERAAGFILENQYRQDGTLYHAYREQKSYVDGFLEDYAHLISAMVSLFEAGGNIDYLTKAEELTAQALKSFYNPGENVFYTTSVQDRIVQRDIEVSDVTLPSSNAVMAQNLFRLGKLTGTSSYQKMAEEMTSWMAAKVLGNTLYFSHWAELMLHEQTPYYEVVAVGDNAENLIKELRKEFIPLAVFAFSNEPRESLPLFTGRHKPGETLIYICRNNSCGLPVRTVDEALTQIQDANL